MLTTGDDDADQFDVASIIESFAAQPVAPGAGEARGIARDAMSRLDVPSPGATARLCAPATALGESAVARSGRGRTPRGCGPRARS